MSRRAPLMATLAVLLLGGCSLALDFSDECSVDTDCPRDRVCQARVCVARVHQHDQGPSDAGPSDAGRADMGPPVLPAFCNQIYGQPPARFWGENTIRLGLLVPKTGDLGAVGGSIAKAVFLAVDEINQSGGLGQKRFGVIACDTGTNPMKAAASAAWLTEVAGVPAILGPSTSASTLQVFADVALETGTLIMSPSATSPAITEQADEGLLWRTAPSDAIQGRAISAYLEASGIEKVAVLNRNDAYGNGLAETVRRSLCTTRACSDETFFNRRYDPDDLDQLLALSSEVRDFAPDALVLIAFVADGIELVNLADLIEVRRLLLTDGTRDEEVLMGVRDMAALSDAIGTAPAPPQGDTCAAFKSRFVSQWGHPPNVFNGEAYDGMYLLGYAIAGLKDGPITGRAIAEQLGRVSSGPVVEAGPTDWNRGLRLMRQGGTIDYLGASGDLDFDANGEAPNDVEAWRFDLEAGEVKPLGTMFTADGEYRPVGDGADQGPPSGDADAGE